MRSSSWVGILYWLWLAVVLIGGCGRNPAHEPTVLSEEEKERQIRELNEQRAEEWGMPKRK